MFVLQNNFKIWQLQIYVCVQIHTVYLYCLYVKLWRKSPMVTFWNYFSCLSPLYVKWSFNFNFAQQKTQFKKKTKNKPGETFEHEICFSWGQHFCSTKSIFTVSDFRFIFPLDFGMWEKSSVFSWMLPLLSLISFQPITVCCVQWCGAPASRGGGPWRQRNTWSSFR